jgi:hypothetical protein
MRPAVNILAFFAALWWCLGVWASGHGSIPAYAAPVFVSAVLVFLVLRRPDAGAQTADERSRIGMVVGIASAAEGLAIFLAVNVLANFGASPFDVDAIAIAVGLHFVPLAYWLKVHSYYTTAGLMCAVGVAGIWIAAGEARILFVCLSCACILWGTLARRLLQVPPIGSKAPE